MKTRLLRDIISNGETEILSSNPNHPDAIAYMAYHAGISAGQAHTGKAWLAAVSRGLTEAKQEHCHIVASRHIYGPQQGDGDLRGAEHDEIMGYDYPAEVSA